MIMGKTSAAVKNRWNEANYDRLSVFTPKGKKEQIKAFAEKRGESVNSFINWAIDEAMKQSEE